MFFFFFFFICFISLLSLFFFFFFNNTSTTEIYTLSLHDALPILKYSKERHQFGKPISSFQAIAFKLADMATEIEASELLLHKSASLKNNNLPMTTIGAMAKMYASEMCVKASTEAIQIHGGYGYTKDFPVEKFFRDSKLCTIGEGTTEIQKLVISRNILKE